jgi:uncharacterized membrane protein
MAYQLDIFSWTPPPAPPRAMARRNDPSTSHAAAQSVTPDLPELEATVLHALRRSGESGKTLDEICDATGLDKVTASPRLRPLVRKGFVREADFTRPGKSNRQQTVWIAIEETA